MDGPSGLNQPRRKSRLRSREGDYVRRPSTPTAPGEEQPPTGASAPSPAYDPGLEYKPGFGPAAAPVEDVDEAPPLGAGASAPAPETLGEGEDLPEAFRLNKVYESAATRNPLTDWRWLMMLFALVAGGMGAGYKVGKNAAAPEGVSPRNRYLTAVRSVVGQLDPKVQAEVDTAFEAMKKGRYEDALRLFSALREKHPEWPSMAVESARACLYRRDTQQAQNILGVLTANRLTPDADFMMALLHLTNNEFDLAEESFGLAVALDPARPDFYYFWGECLRRDGKPQEAIEKFRAALLRNQYENAEGLFQLKLWLSEIQADKEESSGGGKEIDAALAQARPPYEALFAAAGARDQSRPVRRRSRVHHQGAGDHRAGGISRDHAGPDVSGGVRAPAAGGVLQITARLRRQEVYFVSSTRPVIARESVSSSADSRPPPAGSPWAMRVTVNAGKSLSSPARYCAVASPSTSAPSARMISVAWPSRTRASSRSIERSSGPT